MFCCWVFIRTSNLIALHFLPDVLDKMENMANNDVKVNTQEERIIVLACDGVGEADSVDIEKIVKIVKALHKYHHISKQYPCPSMQSHQAPLNNIFFFFFFVFQSINIWQRSMYVYIYVCEIERDWWEKGKEFGHL